MPINQKRQDLVQTLRATVESMTSLAGERQVRMDMPATTLAVYDQEIVARVVANLLSNAFKFTPDDGTVKVILERHADHVRVSVTDSGPGIAPEYHRKIFDKFCQAELRHAEIGTGLGLSFCNLAVEAHGGQIGVESAPGCGSTFWFTLPVGAEE
jgi:signal transduction histidine kinase